MAISQCEVCGNHYDKTFQVLLDNQTHTFDSFECAISALAPFCAHCRCRVLGHGVQKGERIFCSAHCAHEAGVHELQDRA